MFSDCCVPMPRFASVEQGLVFGTLGSSGLSAFRGTCPTGRPGAGEDGWECLRTLRSIMVVFWVHIYSFLQYLK